MTLEHQGHTLTTQVRYMEFSNVPIADADGIAIQHPDVESKKFSRLQVDVKTDYGTRRHVAGHLPFALRDRELDEPARVRDILNGLGYPSEGWRFQQCREFSPLDGEQVLQHMLDYLRFTLVLMCYRWESRKRSFRLRERHALLGAVGAGLDPWHVDSTRRSRLA